ncbi:MAG TPA: ribokinase [Ktedonobacterales bacterium]|jgi:ribokinase
MSASVTAPRIAVVGSANADLTVRVPHVPRPGETVLGGDLTTAPGGKGANQAVAARRLGAAVSLIACLGTDEFGDALAEKLAQEGLRLNYLRRVPDATTGVALVAVDPDGQNSIAVAPGANARLSVEDVDRAEPALRTAQAVLAQLEVPLAAVRQAFTLARAARAITVLNPAPRRPLADALVGLVDVLVCNEFEAEALVGGPVVGSAQAVVAAAGALLRRGPRLVVITRGRLGCVVAEPAGVRALAAFDVPAVDETAAGDAFIGALACRLALGEATLAAARYASAAAAIAVGREGAQPSLPTAEEVEDFLAVHPPARDGVDRSGIGP